MTSINVIENKISSIRKYLKILSNYKSYSLDEIKNDLTIKGALERYLYLLVQATIDLAEAVIAFKDFRKPKIYSEAFEILREEGVITDELAENFVKMVGFRNIIAHDYENVDFNIVYDVLQHKISDIEKLVKQVKEKLDIN